MDLRPRTPLTDGGVLDTVVFPPCPSLREASIRTFPHLRLDLPTQQLSTLTIFHNLKVTECVVLLRGCPRLAHVVVGRYVQWLYLPLSRASPHLPAPTPCTLTSPGNLMTLNSHWGHLVRCMLYALCNLSMPFTNWSRQYLLILFPCDSTCPYKADSISVVRPITSDAIKSHPI